MNLRWQGSPRYMDPFFQRSQIAWLATRCAGFTPQRLMSGSICDLGSAAAGAPTIVLWGDSHASRLTPVVDQFGKDAGVRVMVRVKPGCAPLVGEVFPGTPGIAECRRFVDSVVSEVTGSAGRIRGVIIAARWNWIFGTSPRERVAAEAFSRELLGEDPSSVGVRADRALRVTVEMLSGAGVRSLLVSQPPDWPRYPGECDADGRRDGCRLSRADVAASGAKSKTTLLAVERAHRLARVLDLDDALCLEATCVPFSGDTMRYDDPSHLSVSGARSIRPAIQGHLEWVAARHN